MRQLRYGHMHWVVPSRITPALVVPEGQPHGGAT